MTNVPKHGLGKNLAALGLKELLSDLKEINHQVKEPTTTITSRNSVSEIAITAMRPGKYQPRKAVDPNTLEELATSIKAQGIIQPLILRPIGNDNYEIIAGERRWRAAQIAGLSKVPVIVREISDREALAISLIENIQRENLNAIDEALALERLIDEFGMTHQEVADAVGKSRTTVTNLLRLLSLNEEVKILLAENKIEMGHARALLTLPTIQQFAIAQKIMQKNLSVRETEGLVQNLQKTARSFVQKVSDPNITSLQHQLSEKLGARVIISNTKNKKGKLTIFYNSLDELEGILSRIR